MGFTLPWEVWMRTALKPMCEEGLEVLSELGAFAEEEGALYLECLHTRKPTLVVFAGVVVGGAWALDETKIELPDVKKRVLIAVDWFPPAFKAGGPIRSACNLAAFLSQTHEVWVVTGNRDLDEEQPLDVRADEWSTIGNGHRTIQVRYTSGIDKGQWRDILDEVKLEVIHLNSCFRAASPYCHCAFFGNDPNVRGYGTAGHAR